MLWRLWLLVVPNQASKQGTRSPIELLWTAKNNIPLISRFSSLLDKTNIQRCTSWTALTSGTRCWTPVLELMMAGFTTGCKFFILDSRLDSRLEWDVFDGWLLSWFCIQLNQVNTFCNQFSHLRFQAAVGSPLNQTGAAEEAAGYLSNALEKNKMSKL